MNRRLREIIAYKTNGNQAQFAALMEWTPQYLANLLRDGGSIGIRPVVALLQRIPEIDARWLLLGEGAMVSSGVDAAKEHLLRLLSLEKYMPVMSPEELRMLTEDGFTDFSDSDIQRWSELLAAKQHKINSAIQRSCIPPTAR